METREKFEYYVIPEGEQDKLHKDGVSREELKDFQLANADELKEKVAGKGELISASGDTPATLGQCIPRSSYTSYCTCGATGVQKPATCTVYHDNITGAYCYTLCESCYVACNR
jgi:hypothetical protein